MLLKKEHINSAMSLDAVGVSFAVRNKGYTDDSVKTAVFGGMTTSGSFVYYCTYADSDTGKDEDCIIYVRYTERGVLTGEY